MLASIALSPKKDEKNTNTIHLPFLSILVSLVDFFFLQSTLWLLPKQYRHINIFSRIFMAISIWKFDSVFQNILLTLRHTKVESL